MGTHWKNVAVSFKQDPIQVRTQVRNFIAAIAVATATVTPARAEPVTFEFEGVISSIIRVTTTDPFGSAIAVGTTFSGRYTFNTTSPNQGTNGYGVYIETVPPYGIAVQVGSLSGTSTTALLPLHYRVITEGLSNDDVIQDIQTQDFLFGGVNAYLAQVFLRAPTGVLTSVDLSSAPPDLTQYSVHTFVLGIGPPTHAADVVYFGDITAIRSVPEPSTPGLLLLAAATAILIGNRRERD